MENSNDFVTVNVDDLEPMQQAMLGAILEQGARRERERILAILDVLLMQAAVDGFLQAELALEEAFLVIKDEENA